MARGPDAVVAEQPVEGGVADVVLDDGVVPVEDGDRLVALRAAVVGHQAVEAGLVVAVPALGDGEAGAVAGLAVLAGGGLGGRGGEQAGRGEGEGGRDGGGAELVGHEHSPWMYARQPGALRRPAVGGMDAG
ncbi:hypothetical protein GCM10019017_64730 [Streptomyces showdoensis]